MAERVQVLARRTPWLALSVLLGIPAGLLVLRGMDAVGLGLPPCVFHRFTGLPCATCGMTRMVRALAAGDLGAAFHWHPAAAALLLASPLAALWDLHRAWRGEPFPALPDTGRARALAVGLFAAVWALQILRGI
jgi:hypothetical protein